MTESGFSKIAPKAFARAGMTPADIRMFHPYDDFTIAVVMQLEDFGFAARGKGCDYVLATDLSFGASSRSIPAAGRFPPASRGSPAVGSISWKPCARCSARAARAR